MTAGPVALLAMVMSAWVSMAACGSGEGWSRAASPCPSGLMDRLVQQPKPQVDLLFVVGNSPAMADKADMLAETVPDLVAQLANPRCVAPDGAPSTSQPTSPTEHCPEGFARELEPILDLHIGVVSASLGDHGGDLCPGGASGAHHDDHGRLLDRAPDGSVVATYEGLGFLAWDPGSSLSPPGEGDLETLRSSLRSIVLGSQGSGCPLQAPLEAWYRFLADPAPYESIEAIDGQAVPTGTDALLLAEREAFLRPGSFLIIVILTDENDCSIRDGGQFFYAAKSMSDGSAYHLPRAQNACATNPNDPCCRSCGQSDDGCLPKGEECASPHDDLSDPYPLRCWDQKRRFGIDFLYPLDRYVGALAEAEVHDSEGNLHPNPIYRDLDLDDDEQSIRHPSMVLLAGLVGVPWQDIARPTAGPDGQCGTSDDAPPTTAAELRTGCTADGEPTGGLQSAAELVANGTWQVMVGDPGNYVPATDPHMIESIDPRAGLPGPDAPYLADPVSGHEWTAAGRDELQYACITPLPLPRDCAASPAPAGCDCMDADNDKPVCESPDGTNGTTQHFADARPGLRQLALLERVGEQALVGSICPAELTDPSLTSFGYRPLLGTLREKLGRKLAGQCLPLSLTPDAAGQVPCFMLEARHETGDCVCDHATGRRPVDPANGCSIESAKQDPLYELLDWNCFCEIAQLGGDGDPAPDAEGQCDDPLCACQYDPTLTDSPQLDGEPVNGWCYIDATTVPSVGDPALAAGCPADERRLLRSVGEGVAVAGSVVFVRCGGE